jgi:hypothetical protein
MPPPQPQVYPRYAVVAEKLEAIASFGILNSQLKDYFDLWILARHADFDGAVLTQAIRAIFERRHTGIPAGVPLGLSDEFALDEQKNKQWTAFQRKNALEPTPLATVIEALRQFLLPVLRLSRRATTTTAGGVLARVGINELPLFNGRATHQMDQYPRLKRSETLRCFKT